MSPAFWGRDGDSNSRLVAAGTTLNMLWLGVVVDVDSVDAGAFVMAAEWADVVVAVEDFILVLSGRTGLLAALGLGDTTNLSPTKLCTLLARP